MVIEYDREDVKKALEYLLRDVYLSTYKIEYELSTYFDTDNEAWCTEIKAKEDKDVE